MVGNDSVLKTESTKCCLATDPLVAMGAINSAPKTESIICHLATDPPPPVARSSPAKCIKERSSSGLHPYVFRSVVKVYLDN